MAPKRSGPMKMSVVKKARRVINLETKLDIIKRSERGFSGAAIARALGLRDSTVRTILKNSDRIKQISQKPKIDDRVRKVQRLTTMPTKRPISCKAVSLEIENQITSWYTHETRKGNIINFDEFKIKALSTYKELTKDYSNTGLFTVSKELFEFCKQRYNAMSDTSSEAASAENEEMNSAAQFCEVVGDSNSYDLQAANAFSQSFTEIVEEGGYTPLQIFSVSETHLFWKRLPIKEVNDKRSLKDSIDHITLLLGCNAIGDFKLKPLMVNFIDNPKSLLGYPKDKLPVIWKTNKKASVTQLIFSDWFTGYFCPAVEQYCIKNNLDNKALLVVNCSPGYPTSLDDLSANVKVVFLPSEVSSVMQPFNETFMKVYKANYCYQTLCQLLAEYENTKPFDVSFEELWNSYDIRKAINNIVEAWNEIKPSTLNKVWQQLFPNYVADFLGLEDDVEKIHESMTEITKELGLEDININYFHEELNFDTDKINNEQWIELINKKKLENLENDDDVIQIKSLSVTMLGEAIKNLETAMTIIRENDPDYERSSSVCNTIKNVTASYRQLYRDKRKSVDLSVDKYFKNQIRNAEPSEHSISSEPQSTNSNEPQPSNIPVPIDIKLEYSSAESPLSDI